MAKINDAEIVCAVISHRTNKEAAAAVGLSESQLYERMQASSYRDLLNSTIAAQLEHVAGELRDRLTMSVDTITEIMQSADASPSVRLAAANSIITHYCNMASASRCARKTIDIDKEDDNKIIFHF